MKALILASGAGRRLQPLTDHLPKPLIKVGNKSILDYQLESLIRYGISEIIVTTGPFREKVEEYIRGNYSIKTTFIHNPKYETTNYIFSLWLTKEVVGDDMILLHGDLVFDSVLIGKLIKAEGNRVLVNEKIKPPKKDFKAVIESNRVIKIGVEFSGSNAYFCAPIYKCLKMDFRRWLAEVEKFIEKGHVNYYAEDAFNKISSEIMLRPLYFEEFCMEIDTMDDLQTCIRHII